MSPVNQKVVLASAPALIHHVRSDIAKRFPLMLETRATLNVSCKVVVAVEKLTFGGWRVNSAVQYQDGDKFYTKEVLSAGTLSDALRLAYGLSRKLYRVTASRALAGLLHDSVVPATDDIEC